jgi:endonuclease/exonuclease/phosphatase family metal-dependent hydrolase
MFLRRDKMKLPSRYVRSYAIALAVSGASLCASDNSIATTLRIATYNINADTSSFENYPQSANLETVLQGIGDEHLNDNGVSNAQPIDVLALQELPNGSGGASAPSLSSIVANLNAEYGAGTYAYDSTRDPTDAGSTGNGPSGLIYNTKTVKVISATALGTVSGSGAPRAPMQYLIQPVGYSSAADFYVDVSHMKSGSDSSSASRREVEATTIASNATSLGANAHIIALGDFNINSGSSEPTYKTLTTQFGDLGNPAENWSDTSASLARQFSPLLSESATSVRYRDDIQFATPAAESNSVSPIRSLGMAELRRSRGMKCKIYRLIRAYFLISQQQSARQF